MLNHRIGLKGSLLAQTITSWYCHMGYIVNIHCIRNVCPNFANQYELKTSTEL
jgi:DNA-binding LytR/AlgR family response regulator